MLIREFDTVLFDLADTLVHLEMDWKPARKRLRQELMKYGSNLPCLGFSGMINFAFSAGWFEVKELGATILKEVEGPATIIPLTKTVTVAWSLRDKSLGIVTNNLKITAERAIREMNLEIFNTIVGYEDVRRVKPDPEGVELALSRLNADRSTSVLIGDREVDRTAALAAGIRFCFVEELYEG